MVNTLNQLTKSVTLTGSSPRIALIGCGAIAESYYLPALAMHPAILENLVLVDPDLGRTQAMACKYKIKTCFSDYHKLANEVDGAILAVPTHLHYPIAMEFLSKGVHVLCEKPLTENADQARHLIEIAQQNETVLAANYLQRLVPCFAKVKEFMQRRSLGEPLFIQYIVGEEFRWPTISGFYFNSRPSSRGVLRDRGAHVIDHICWWLEGRPELISSQNDSFGGSEAVAQMKFVKGKCTGEVRLSWLANIPSTFRVDCEKGTIYGNVYDYVNLMVESPAGNKQHISLKSSEKTKKEIAAEVISNFINVITRGEKPLVSGIDILDSIIFIDECYSAATRLEMPWYEIMEVEGA
jgi:predicted dehydrogenase